jgi:hypothetical protein
MLRGRGAQSLPEGVSLADLVTELEADHDGVNTGGINTGST